MKLKRLFPTCAPWDAAGMADHLEQMEASGWQFRGTDWLGRWEFTPTEPKTVRWAVTFVPKRRSWRLTPTEDEQELEFLCFDAGWRKIAVLPKCHIYRNADPNASELENDEDLRLKVLDRAFDRAFLANALVSLIYPLLIFWSLQRFFLDQPLRVLSMPELPALLLFPFWLVMNHMVPWLMFRFWRRKARRAASDGLPTPAVRGWKYFSAVNGCLMGLLFLLLLRAKPWMLAVYAIVFGLFAVLRNRLERSGEDNGERERKFQNLQFWFVIALVIANIYFNYQSVPAGDHPLSLRDFGVTEFESFDMDHNEGFLADYQRYQEASVTDNRTLYCSIFESHTPWFREVILEEYENDEAVEVDAAPWGADKVLRAGKVWYIHWGDRIVVINASWELTEEQIALAARLLAPGKEGTP